MLNPNAPIPLYRQLADGLTAKIRSGEFPVGSRIPSEPQLASAHGLGRPTIRQALDLLVRKGLLVRRRGSGTYVCEPRQAVDLFSLDGTAASFRRQGVVSHSRILQPITLQWVNQPDDHPFHGRQAYCFSRLTSAEGVPVLMETICLHAELFAGIDRIDMQNRSLSAVAEEHFFLQPSGGRQSFRIGYARGAKARHLQVSPQTPVLLVHRRLHFPQAANGLFSEMWCRTDRFVFSQTLGGPDHA